MEIKFEPYYFIQGNHDWAMRIVDREPRGISTCYITLFFGIVKRNVKILTLSKRFGRKIKLSLNNLLCHLRNLSPISLTSMLIIGT